MDIAALSTIMSQVQVKQQANLSVMKMTMDTGNNQAVDMLQMLNASAPQADQAVDPNLGRTIDIKL
ncbi:YjfB family protein [Oceanobacillus sp. CAU 1775]